VTTCTTITARGNQHRLRSEAAFAALCAANPIPASSGKTTRYRLNPAGDRATNATLQMIAVPRNRRWKPLSSRESISLPFGWIFRSVLLTRIGYR
jgi:hypothetical protein